MRNSIRDQQHPLLSRIAELDALTRDRLADRFAELAAEKGLLYLAPNGPRPIPVAFPPAIEPQNRTRGRSELVRSITAALASTARGILGGALGPQLRDELLAELAPIEREIVERRYAAPLHLATVRGDLFVDASGRDRLLEINATIPAMQAYSDMATAAFVEAAVTVLGGREAEAALPILEENGSNQDDLLRALLGCYRAEGGAAERPSIALVHRPDDSQLFELRSLAARFQRMGHDARTVEAQELSLGADGRAEVVATGFRPELLYRHIFATKVDPASPFAQILRAPDGHFLFNPVDPHLEQKSLLAELSAASVDPERSELLGVSAERAALVRAHVPWTRRLRPGPSSDPAGGLVSDLLDFVHKGQACLVLKRSWDFGGKGVFLGAEYGDEGSLQRAGERFGGSPSWSELVEACAAEGGWIAQERVPLEAKTTWIARGHGAVETEVFVDVSAYTDLSDEQPLADRPSGGVCRASPSAIVNIQSGGGVVPLLSSEAADRLLSLLDG